MRIRPGIAAFVVLLAVYAATLAPGVTLWDAGEFLAAIHSFGIPHPPGTPLYVIFARVWSFIFAPITGFAVSVNLLSAVCSAAACGLLATLLHKWNFSARAAFAGAVCAGVTSTLWLSSNETEIYAPALLLSILILWCANNTRLYIVAYLCGLAWALHLTALLTVPAALYLLWSSGLRLHRRHWRAIPILLLGMSPVLFMLIRAQHDPAINQGNPSNLVALWDVITRAQYDKPPLWPRQAPLYLQFGNLLEYADWQVALGLAPEAPPSWLRTPFTLLFVALGIFGCIQHRSQHRLSWRALIILFITTTAGVITYLNLKAGPTYGFGILPDSAPREARERDYFFILAFVCWGLWAGIGAVRIFRERAIGVAAAMLPMILNWGAVTRSGNTSARDRALRLLTPAPPKAVLLVSGDNNTYPLWYMQQVEGYRKDVTVVTIPLLAAEWYREQLGLVPVEWYGLQNSVSSVRSRASALGRPVIQGR